MLRQMGQKVGIGLMALAFFSLAGGHWALLQGIAWANMIQTYSQEGSFSSAIQKTFSGNYRCTLCKKISEGQQKEKQDTASSGFLTAHKKTILFFQELIQPFFSPPKASATFTNWENHYSGPVYAPPTHYP